jgi:hypothetical protein
LALGVAATLLCFGTARAATPRQVSPGQFRGDVSAMQEAVAACQGSVTACDADKVSADEEVGKPGKDGGFAVHWDWLRDALTNAHKAKPDDRTKLLLAASERLQTMAEESGSPSHAGDHFVAARAQADRILAEKQFGAVTSPSLWQRLTARLVAFLGRLFGGVARIGHAAPWLLTLAEWGLFLGAGAGLLFFALRAFAQQKLKVSLNESGAKLSAWDRESTDWALLAERHAAQGDWREAVHGLYWAAIIHLEARRAWRHNPSRTPREYVRLLKPGSEQQSTLRGLTQIFERVWYGFGEAGDAEYRRARSMYDGLARGTAVAEAAAKESA